MVLLASRAPSMVAGSGRERIVARGRDLGCPIVPTGRRRDCVERDPTNSDRASIEAKMASLQILANQPNEPEAIAPHPSPTTSPAPPPPSGTPPRRRLYTWIVGGAGVALLAAALGTGLASHAAYSDLLGKCGPDHDL